MKGIELNLHESSPTMLSERETSAVHSSNTASLPGCQSRYTAAYVFKGIATNHTQPGHKGLKQLSKLTALWINHF